MNKTLVEIYNEVIGMHSALCAVFDAIESRLSALEHPAKQNPVIDALDKAKVRIAKYNSDDRLGEIIDEIKSESTLEHPEPDKQPPALEKPAETEREWITPSSYVWVRRLRDGEIFNVRLSEVVLQPDKFTHIMPYHEGEPKPEAPKESGK